MDRVADRTIGALLLSAFKSRYKEVLTKAHTAAYPAASKHLTILTKEETHCEILSSFFFFFFFSYLCISSILLTSHVCIIYIDSLVVMHLLVYEAAQSSMAAFKKWRMGGPRFQRASILGRKRKSN
jgi:GINS complex subunit 3